MSCVASKLQAFVVAENEGKIPNERANGSGPKPDSRRVVRAAESLLNNNQIVLFASSTVLILVVVGVGVAGKVAAGKYSSINSVVSIVS